MSQPLSRPPCLSWRIPGGFWQITESGEGETVRIRSSLRDINIDGLTNADLEQLRYLIGYALEARQKPEPDTP